MAVDAPAVEIDDLMLREYYVRRMAKRLLCKGRDLSVVFVDNDAASAEMTGYITGGAGTNDAQPAGLYGGWQQHTGGDDVLGGKSSVYMNALPNAQAPYTVHNARTGRWAAVIRMQCPTTPAAGTVVGLNFIEPLTGAYVALNLGIDKTAHATKFCASDNAGTALGVSSVSFDTATHILEMWSNGVSPAFFSVDGETPVSVANVNLPTVRLSLLPTASAAALLAKQTLRWDFCGLMAVRT